MPEPISHASPLLDTPPNEDDPISVIETRRLTKRMRGKIALRNVSLTVRPGQVYGLLGAAGAGKTTLAKILMGFLHPDSGEVHLFGPKSLMSAKMRTGYLPQRARYHSNISGRDYLRFHAGLGGLKSRDAARAALAAEEAVGLGDAAKKRIGRYSQEQIRRLGLAVAMVSGGLEPPDLLVLDEPTAGIGEELGETMRDVVRHCQERGSTVLICSQDLTPVEKLCTHVGILRSGRLIAQTPVDPTPRTNLVGLPREGAMAIAPDLLSYLAKLHVDVTIEGGLNATRPLHVGLPTGPTVPRSAALKAAAIRAMLDARWDIISVYEEYRDLESLYLQAVPSTPKVGDKGTPEEPEPAKELERPSAAAEEHRIVSTSSSPVTSPLSEPETAPSKGTGKLGAVTTAPLQRSGPSTQPLGPLPEESTLVLLAAQLEPRKLRDRTNGAARPPADMDTEAQEEDAEKNNTTDIADPVSDGR